MKDQASDAKPRLENWKVCLRLHPYRAAELCKSCLVGEVYNHPDPRHADGKRVETSVLKCLNSKEKTAITESGTEYILGNPDKEWLDYIAENNYTVSQYDK